MSVPIKMTLIKSGHFLLQTMICHHEMTLFLVKQDSSWSDHQFYLESIDTINFKRTCENVNVTGIFSFNGIQRT